MYELPAPAGKIPGAKCDTTAMSEEQNLMLAKLERARLALAESRTLPEVKRIRDIAEAARVYAKAAHLSRESQHYASEIALLASRKAGEIFSRLERKPGQRRDKPAAMTAGGSEYRKALEDSDTPERTAQLWQKLAQVSEKNVNKYIASCRELDEDITAAGLLREYGIRLPRFKPPKMRSGWTDTEIQEGERLWRILEEKRRERASAPPPTIISEGFRITAEVQQAASEIIKAGHRQLAAKRHPDMGGSTEAMQDLNVAATWLRNLIQEGERAAA